MDDVHAAAADAATDADLGLSVSQQPGATLVRLLPAAVLSDDDARLRGRLRTIVSTTTHSGLILDCRELPANAAERLAPVLFELVVHGRRRTPALEICVVGEPGQTTGSHETFLAPRRFGTLEAASALLHVRQPGTAPQRLGRGNISHQPLAPLSPGPGFWQTLAGQSLLTVAVVGFTCALIGYSAVASFAPPVMPRRHTGVPTARIAIRGNVMVAKGKSFHEDPAAVVLAWPAAPVNPTYELTVAQVLSGARPPHVPKIIIAHTGEDGQFAIWRGQLTGAANAEYCLLAVSRNVSRPAPPSDADRKALSQYFADPGKLLGDRQYALRQVMVRPDDMIDQVFIFGTPGDETAALAPATSDPAADEHPAENGAADERAPTPDSSESNRSGRLP